LLDDLPRPEELPVVLRDRGPLSEELEPDPEPEAAPEGEPDEQPALALDIDPDALPREVEGPEFAALEDG
jgi:hypothetical protein